MAAVATKGFSFSDDNSIGLNEGPANCLGAYEVVNGGGTFFGVCTFSYKEGDMIFISFTGDPVKNEGQVVPTGGTGKYKGITGTGKWECKGGKNGESMCRQSITYKLP